MSASLPDSKTCAPSSAAGDTSGQTPAQRPRPRLPALSPSSFMPMLFSENDEDNDESDSEILGLEDSDSDWESVNSDEERVDCDGDSDKENTAPIQDSSTFSFHWSEGSDFVPHVYKFSGENSGTTENWPCTDDSQESDFFLAFLDNDVMSFIADSTNKFYRYEYQHKNISPCSRILQWVDTTARELKVFIALMMLMSLCKKHVLDHYWRNDALIPTPIFGKYMTRDRFLLLLSFLHFADNETPDVDDKIWKVREIFSMFLSRYRKYFYPFQKLVIDESLMLFKGRLVFKQYIPSKRHRFGIKLFVLCDCESGVVMDMIVYTGSNRDVPSVSRKDPMGTSGALVKKMMAPYLGKGHVLYTDNWYTSPALSQFLHENKTGSCGTVKNNRKLMPKFLGDMTHLENPSSGDEDTANDQPVRRKRQKKRKQLYVQREKSGTLLAVKWNDRRPVHLLSTIHRGEIANTGKIHHRTKKPIKKPDVVVDYINNMRLVDKADSQLSGVECLRKSVKWHHKFFFHLIDITMLNAYNIWLLKKEMCPTKKLKLRAFLYAVIFQLLEKFGEPRSCKRGHRHVPMPDRIKGSSDRHYPVHTEMGNGRRKRVNCHVCLNTSQGRKKKTRVNVICNECKVGLCIGECFRIYHSLKNF